MKKIIFLLMVILTMGCHGQGNFFWSHNTKEGYGLLYNSFVINQRVTVKYGYLYNYYSLANIAKTGWHVPTWDEWTTLSTYLGGGSHEGGKMKETGTTYWNSPNTGADNSSGFNGRGSGTRMAGGNFSVTKQTLILASTYYSGGTWILPQLSNGNDDFQTASSGPAYYGVSIRLICNSSTDPGFYVGNDNKIYPTVKIGNQIWMACNLMETLDNTLTSIPEITDNATWPTLTTAARCSYSNIESNSGEILGNIAITGWHVPSFVEWNMLTTYLGGQNISGQKLKEIGIKYWDSPNTGTNLVGFNARGTGLRNPGFSNLKQSCFFATTTSSTPITAIYYDQNSFYGGVSAENVGRSIRLIKDDSTNPGTVTDIDGNVYPTIKIGNQVWMAANLKVKKYSNGDVIPNITDNSSWSLAVTGAWCYYNNDPKKE